MEFHSWPTLYSFSKQRHNDSHERRLKYPEPPEYYQKHIDYFSKSDATIELQHLESEKDWYESKRPYYNVWPGVIPLLTRISLDLPSHLIEAPFSTLNLRFPVKDNPMSFTSRGQKHFATGVLMTWAEHVVEKTKYLQLWIDIGEKAADGSPAASMRAFPISEELTIEEALSALPNDPSAKLGIEIPNSFFMLLMRLACTLCLLEDDPEIIEPDVLADDRSQFETTRDLKYVEKAHRRGKLGWNVGKNIETIPHYRRPHLALFWTGKGRTVPKIGPRKGSIVKRSIVGEIPTGYLDE